MTSPLHSSTIDSLPKQFVSAMQTLFDIMDDKKTGFVNISDIENRWQDDGCRSLPKGVIESLQKVTPTNGLLSFERFCAGLKICLLRNQVERNQNPLKQRASEVNDQSNRPPSAPLLDAEGAPKSSWNNTAAVRPNAVISQQRTVSMPQLLTGHKENIQSDAYTKPMSHINKPALYGPPKPPRTSIIIDRGGVAMPASNMDRADIRTALQNWQIGVMLNDQDNNSENRSMQYSGVLRPSRSLGDGKAAAQTDLQVGIYQKKPNVRRREPRRHTLQNGIDYNMLKRMKQIEQEKDVLMQGLAAIEKAKDWYLKQIAAVQEKMKYLGRMGHVEHWSETQQERLELKRARVFEVNRHLAALTDSWERGGLPLHMNLAVQHHYPLMQPHDPSSRLKQQNHHLTEEIGKKSERISMLEREKASLIRELLQIRAQTTRNNQEEAIF